MGRLKLEGQSQKDVNSLLSLSSVWTIVGDSSVIICFQKCESFKTTQELVRKTLNLLVVNTYW